MPSATAGPAVIKVWSARGMSRESARTFLLRGYNLGRT